MRWKIFGIVFLAALALVAGLMLRRSTSNIERMQVATFAGETIQLLEHNFKPGNVRYEFYGGPWTKRFAKLLPPAARRRFGLTPMVSIATFPTNQPGLSAAFRPMLNGHAGLRLIVRDDRGNEFDEAIHDAGWNAIWVKEVKAFPRRVWTTLRR